MVYSQNKAENIKIAYIGGGSRGWAWGLMSDLVSCENMSGEVFLYDIDFNAAQDNEIIGNMFNQCEGAKSVWSYHAVRTAQEAMQSADFVIISILPGTFDEMESDVHTPEKYGIYQSVGDSTGPAGILRAMRAVPMYEEIALNIKAYCPDAWVISYTNPMTLCIKTLYRIFPQIKAFGCCHEVFGTQYFLAQVLENILGISGVARKEIKVNPIGVNHFTWLTKAQYKNIDLFPVYKEFCSLHALDGYADTPKQSSPNPFASSNRVKMDLFLKYGSIAAAGDRHLAEFCNGKWYLESPQSVEKWGFYLTTVASRKQDLKNRLQKSRELIRGERKACISATGEEGINQMQAILGLGELVSNINIPNMGQIPNLPLGAIVETNALFRAGSVTPVHSGEVPVKLYPLIARICAEQESLNSAIAARDIKQICDIFCYDPLVTCRREDAQRLFLEMVENTRGYLTSYFNS